MVVGDEGTILTSSDGSSWDNPTSGGDNFYGQLGIGTTDDMGNNTGEMATLTGIDL